MDIKSIMEILRLVNKSDLTEVEIEEKDFKIKIKRGGGEVQIVPSQNLVSLPTNLLPQSTAIPLPMVTPSQEVTQASTTPATETKQEKSPSNLYIFKSPMIGTFYRAPGPDKEPFVKVGDIVSKKQVLCIVEAMKLFNEIESEVDGKIVKILVENAQPVEYDQPLFEIALS